MLFLDVELPLGAFFFLAPILFVISHAYTLGHFVLLAAKVGPYNEEVEQQAPDADVAKSTELGSERTSEAREARSSLRRQLPSNIFVQFLVGPRDIREGGLGFLLKAIGWISLVIGPVFSLILTDVESCSCGHYGAPFSEAGASPPAGFGHPKIDDRKSSGSIVAFGCYVAATSRGASRGRGPRGPACDRRGGTVRTVASTRWPAVDRVAEFAGVIFSSKYPTRLLWQQTRKIPTSREQRLATAGNRLSTIVSQAGASRFAYNLLPTAALCQKMPLLAPLSTLRDKRQSDTALLVARGTRRMLRRQSFSTVTELPLLSGRRADVVALGADGTILIIEIKSSVADFRADHKWPEYRAHCDRLYFAIPDSVPTEIMPQDAGLILADAYGAEILREAPEHKMAAATRRAVTIRFAHAAAHRLHGLFDPEALGLGPLG